MKVLAMVLAGGQGSRLHPLTAERSKPAVPFGSRYRIADFVLSNLVNSDIRVDLPAGAVQVAVADRARQQGLGTCPLLPRPVRHRGAAADARGPGMVPGHGRRRVPEHQPDRAPRAGHGRGVRRRPHLPHGRAADGRFPPAECRRTSAVAAIPVPLAEASAFGIIDADARRPHPRLPRKAGPTRRRCRPIRRAPTARWATTCSTPMCCWKRCARPKSAANTISAHTSCRA